MEFLVLPQLASITGDCICYQGTYCQPQCSPYSCSCNGSNTCTCLGSNCVAKDIDICPSKCITMSCQGKLLPFGGN